MTYGTFNTKTSKILLYSLRELIYSLLFLVLYFNIDITGFLQFNSLDPLTY